MKLSGKMSMLGAVAVGALMAASSPALAGGADCERQGTMKHSPQMHGTQGTMGQQTGAQQPQGSQELCVRRASSEMRAGQNKVRQVSGRVINEKSVEMRGTDDVHKVVLLQTERGNRTLAVDLGSESRGTIEAVEVGDDLSAQGVVVRIRDRPLFVADRIEHDGKIIKVDRRAQAEQFSRACQARQRGYEQQRAKSGRGGSTY